MPRRSRNWIPRKSLFKRYAKKLNKPQVKQVKRLINNKIETKHFIGVVSDTNIPQAGIAHDITAGIVQGDGENDLTGLRATPMWANTRIKVYARSSPTTTDDPVPYQFPVRIIIAQYGYLPATSNVIIGDVLEPGPTGLAGPSQVNSPYYHNVKDMNIRILKDFTFVVQPDEYNASGNPDSNGALPSVRCFNLKYKLPLKWHYDQFQSDLNHGEVFLFATTDCPQNDQVYITHTTDFAFKDA